MKKIYFLLIALSFFIITPVFAFTSDTEFAVSFCLTTPETPARHFLAYNETMEEYEIDGCAGGCLIAGDNEYSSYTLATGKDNGDINGGSATPGEHQFVINYSAGSVCLYVDGALIGSCESESSLDSTSFTVVDSPADLTNLQEYATSLTPTEIENLSCDGETPAPALTATSTLEELGTVVIDTTLEFMAMVLTQYFPYALIMLILSLMAGALIGFLLRPLK